jgi:hypothetical protein
MDPAACNSVSSGRLVPETNPRALLLAGEESSDGISAMVQLCVVRAAGQRVCFCTEPVVAGPLWLSSTVNRDTPQRSATVERLSRGTNSAKLDLEAFSREKWWWWWVGSYTRLLTNLEAKTMIEPAAPNKSFTVAILLGLIWCHHPYITHELTSRFYQCH